MIPARLDSTTYSQLQRVFLTICTNARRPWFADDAIVDAVTTQLLRVAREEHCAVLAYCFMPDHIHALVEIEWEGADVRRFVRLMKLHTVYWFRRGHAETLWQRSYFDRTLRSEDGTADVIEYIVGNPVRAGLVEVPDQYPHWGSGVWTRGEISSSWRPPGAGGRADPPV